jgi:signal transduction histidine kinase
MHIALFTTRIWNTMQNMPVLMKVMSVALGMALFLGIGMFWQIHHPYFQLETDEVEEHASFIAQVLAAEVAPMMRGTNTAELQRLLDKITRVVPGIGCTINTIKVLDGNEQVVAQSTNTSPANPKARVLERTAPLSGGLPGMISVALNDSHIDFEIGWHTRHIIATTAIIGFLGLAATWWLMRLVTHPISELVESVRAVKTGNYQVRAPVRAKDEVGELAAAFNDMLSALEQKDAVNHQLLRKLIAAGEEERKRVARELHDHTGQALTSLIASLAALKNGEHTRELNELLALATQTLSEVHDLSRTLRPSVLDELGLVPAFQKLGESLVKRLGVSVDFSAIGLEDGVRLPGIIEVALYRIAQEALTNAMRHGQARSVEVLLHRKTTSVLTVIEDNGKGFDASDWRTLCLRGDHWGLLGIEERASLLGGSLRVESRPGAGTSLFVEIPLAEHANG